MIFIIIGVIIAVLALLGVVIWLLVGRKTYPPVSKGELGENAVSRLLGETIEGEQYVINDLLFCDKSGKSCQIDHIFINKFGVWVIETKNYSGTIYGQENQREWTQVLAYGKTKNKFYNPIKQNTTHIYQLSQILNTSNVFQNIVVFLADADISNIKSNNVYSIYELSAIKTLITGITLSVDRMEYFYNRLLEIKNTSTISREEHIENIHKMQYQLQHGICPRCGNKLVLRNGPTGKFYGCSKYPKCEFTKKIEYK